MSRFDVTSLIIEADYLRNKVRLLESAIARWAVSTSVHRSCDCKFCQVLMDLAVDELLAAVDKDQVVMDAEPAEAEGE